MKKVKSLKELATFMEKLGATKENIGDGFTSWTLHCGPDGEKTKMPGYAASVYDTIIGAERFEAYEIVRAGLDWFKKYFPKQYMVVLD